MTPAELGALYPEATVIGSTALHRAGWTTQIPASIHVAVLDTRMPVEADLYDIVGRPAYWFGRSPDSLWGLPALSPIQAIVDAWQFDDQWRPAPDDLEDDTPWDALRAAFVEAGVPWPAIYVDWRPENHTGGRRIRRT
jgi:hypothetical protein